MAILSTDQSAQLLKAIIHTRVYWPVLIALATGMRRGEALALRWKNLDLDRATLRVMESLEQTKGGLRFKAPKSDRARAITLPDFAIAGCSVPACYKPRHWHDLRRFCSIFCSKRLF